MMPITGGIARIGKQFLHLPLGEQERYRGRGGDPIRVSRYENQLGERGHTHPYNRGGHDDLDEGEAGCFQGPV